MKIYQVQAPDGSIIKIEGPEGASEAQLIQAAQSAFAQKQSKPQAIDPTEGMSGFERFAAGTGKAMVDVGRGVRQYLPQALGGLSNDQIAEMLEMDKPLMRTGAGMAGNIFGNVAMAAPTAFIPGAATIPGSAAIGAAYGALQPSTSLSESAKNIGIGGAAGAAIPAVIRAAQVVKSFVEPFYQGGRETIMGRTLRTAAGGQADDAMRNMQNARELVPGSMPTAGEAANNPGIAALQRTATANDPVAMNQVFARQVAQNDARIAALQGITPDVAAARNARRTIAGAMYDQARAAGLDQQAAQALQPQISSLMQRVPDDVVNQARQLAQVAGEPITDMGSVQGAHYLKKAIDAKISQAVRSGDSGTAGAYEGLQTAYLNLLDQVSPTYATARQTYAQMSQPVNQGKILEDIARRGTNFQGNLTPASFSRAASDQTAQAVTRMPNATLQSSLTPPQFQTIQDITADLLRSNFANTAGRGVGSDTVQKMAFNNMMAQSGLPAMIQKFPGAGITGNIAQRVGQVAYKDANERMAQELAQALLDPQQAARLMQSGTTPQNVQNLIQGLRRGGAAIGASAPGLIQANQQ